MLLYPNREWLENGADGSYAFGSCDLTPRRRYHLLLVTPDQRMKSPLSKRVALLNALEIEVKTAKGERFSLSTFCYQGSNSDSIADRNGAALISSFTARPHPSWRYQLPSDEVVDLDLLVEYHSSSLMIRLRSQASIEEFRVRPFFSLRDQHQLLKFRSGLDFKTEILKSGITKISCDEIDSYLYLDAPLIAAPDWYYNFIYPTDEERGYHGTEDLFTPGYYLAKPDNQGSLRIAAAARADNLPCDAATFDEQFNAEVSRREISGWQGRVRENFVLKGTQGVSIIAGYPWFGEWGRDTFIAIRGLLLASERAEDLEAAYQLFERWGAFIDRGLLPNHFPHRSQHAEYNSIDAPLWYVVSACELMIKDRVQQHDRKKLIANCLQILESYANGTLYNIHADENDGLLFGGQAGAQLTWMDAKIGDYVVTPRIGKPVEIQALWINALTLFERLTLITPRLMQLAQKARTNFEAKFWDSSVGYLADVIESPDHQSGRDLSLRPNQLFAVGGLPIQIIFGQRAKKIVEIAEEQLLTPYGLRTLSRSDQRYVATYQGDQRKRDCAYHQGTVWGWLLAVFLEAKYRVMPQTRETKQSLFKLIEPLLQFAESNNWLFPEIFDGDAPHQARGAPHQAWSSAEVLRALRILS